MENQRLTFLKMQPSDLAELVDISRETFSDAYAHLNSEANMQHYLYGSLSEERLAQELAESQSDFYFVQQNMVTVAYVKVNFGDAQNDLHELEGMELERIYVLPVHQRCGAGKAILNFVSNIAKTKELKCIWLGVWEINEDAIRFYKNYGFQDIGTHPFVMGDVVQHDRVLRLPMRS